MDPIYAYLADGTLSDDKAEAKSIHYQSARYIIMHKTLYRHGHSRPLLRCVTPQQGNYVLREIHEGAYDDHSGAQSLAFKTVRYRNYWPTLHTNALKLVHKCDQC